MPSQTAEFKTPLLSSAARRLPIGGEPQPGGGVHFRVWAPAPKSIFLVIEQNGRASELAVEREADGYCSAFSAEAGPGTRYWYRIDGELLPDPGSRSQPDGPFAASQVIDSRTFTWASPPSEGVSMRGGCFCNPGASESAFGFPEAATKRCLDAARQRGFSIDRFAECIGGGVPVGAVRASMGIPTNERDRERALAIVRSFG